MTPQIVLLSGPLAVGKTAVANALRSPGGFERISSSNYLRSMAVQRGVVATRETLQAIGDGLDEETDFRWLTAEVASKEIHSCPEQTKWFVDAVRKPKQIEHFREAFPKILHVHFTASEDVLRNRFVLRNRDGDNASFESAYDRATSHPNEISARSLLAIADLVVDLERVTALDAANLIISRTIGGDNA